MVVLICCSIWFIYEVPFDYVSSQEFGSIVLERFNTGKTHMQFRNELLYQRINTMFKIIFILMLLFLALITLNHLFSNQFNTEHKNTFSVTKNIKGQYFGEFYPHYRMANKIWHYILMLDIASQIFMGKS